MRYLQILTLIPFLLPLLCRAEDITEDYYFEDLPVVLSVSRLEQPLVETTSSVTIIDEEMINASGARDIPELLRLVPGFIVAYSDGNSPVASYHGFGHEYSRHLQVLINGRPIYSPIFSGVTWADIPFGVNDIERIEVIRGPNAALYGSNSFNGVISITTKQAVSSNKSNVRTKIGNNNYTETYLNQAYLGDDWDYSLTISHKTDDGFDEHHDGQISNKLYSTYNYKLSPENTLTLEGGYINGEREAGNNNSIDVEREADIENYFTRLKWENNNSNGDLLSIQYFYDKYTSEDIYTADIALQEIPETANTGFFTEDELNSIVATISDIDLSFFSIRQEIELTYQPHKTNHDSYRYITGFSYRHDQQNIKQLFNRDDPITTTQSRVFYNGEYKKNNLLLNFGLLIEDNEITGTDNMPKLSLIYSLDGQQAIRYTYSQASRSPVGLEEFSDYQLTTTLNNGLEPTLEFRLQQHIQALALFFPDVISLETNGFTLQNWLSTGNLKRETIRSNEIAYQRYSVDRRYKFDAKIFSNSIDDIISFSGEPPRNFSNTDDLKTYGLELSLDRRFRHYRLASGYSKIKAEGDDIGDRYTKSVPSDIFFLHILYNKKSTTLSSTINYYSETRMLDTSRATSFTYLNIFYKYQSSDIDKKWVSISANKLLDADFEYRAENQVEKLFNIEIGFDF